MPQFNSTRYLKQRLADFIFDPSKHWSEYPCILWDRKPDDKGYGRFKYNGKSKRAHQVAYELTRGPVPEGLELDHLCRNKLCFCPAHLEAVTHAENIRRGESGKRQKEKTHCPQGHPYDAENTRVINGGRMCMECSRVLALAYYHRRKEREGYVIYNGKRMLKVSAITIENRNLRLNPPPPT